MPEITLKKIDRVDDNLINEIIDRIVSSVDPERIVLFGSYAYGQPKKNSDLDILVIMNSKLPRYKRSVPIYNALAGLLIPKDIVVYAPEEIEEWEDVPQAFISTIIKNGKVIYEKN
jgi:predicted nucleotidyltransferase